MTGAAVGFWIAVLIPVLAWVGRVGPAVRIEEFTNGFAALPVAIATSLRLPEWMLVVSFLGYWIAVGGLVGWVTSWRRFRWVAVVLVVGGLLIAHRAAQVRLDQEIGRAIEAVLRALSRR